MKKTRRNPLLFILAFVLLGQLFFAVVSSRYTQPHFESRVFATTGIEFDGSDLHKLNEGAHYFGQTMIGWTRFPSFRSDLLVYAELPDDAGINMRIQERQNVIFTVTTTEPVELESLLRVRSFLQDKMDEYNKNTKTRFVLTNIDVDQVEIKMSYGFGAAITLLLSVVVAIGLLFIRKEFFPPKLKL